MQTLGLSESTPRSESRLRALFWPAIRNRTDLDYIGRQGFWICFLVAVFTVVVSFFAGFSLAGIFDGLFFFLAGVGVRERDRFAGIAAFSVYFLSGFLLGNGFSVVRIIFLALLLANVRGNWLAARWRPDPENDPSPVRLNDTLTDKLTNTMPALLWPKARYVFYVLACIEIGLLVVTLFLPRA